MALPHLQTLLMLHTPTHQLVSWILSRCSLPYLRILFTILWLILSIIIQPPICFRMSISQQCLLDTHRPPGANDITDGILMSCDPWIAHIATTHTQNDYRNHHRIGEMTDEHTRELQKKFHQFAVSVTTISVFHIKGLLNVISRHFGVGFCISRHNVGIYASKLISFRFFVSLIGCVIELILFHLVEGVCKSISYDADKDGIKTAIEQKQPEIARAINEITQGAGSSEIKTHLEKEEVNKKLAKFIVNQGATSDNGKIALIIAKEIERICYGTFQAADAIAKDDRIKTKLPMPISQNIVKDKVWLQFHLRLPDFIAVQIESEVQSIAQASGEGAIAEQISSQAEQIASTIKSQVEKISKLITGDISGTEVQKITEQINYQKALVKGAIIGKAGGVQNKKEGEIKKHAEKIAEDIYRLISTKVKEEGIPEKIMIEVLAKILIGQAEEIAKQLKGTTDRDGTLTASKITGALVDTYKNHIQDEIANGIVGSLAEAEATGVRRIISVISYVSMAITRILFLRRLYTSNNLAYDAYLILNLEGVTWGFVQMTLFPLTPKHSAMTTLAIDLSIITIFFFQLILDRFLFHRPLFMIKIQMWIICTWNVSCIPIWACSIYKMPEDDSLFGDIQADETQKVGELALWSPFWMFPLISFIKDFLFPGVMPFALLTPDQAHLTNIVFPPVYNLGSLLVIFLDGWGGTTHLDIFKTSASFKNWNYEYNAFWLLYVPQITNYIFIFLAIHGDGVVNKTVLGNRPLVLFMDLVMMLCYSIMESLSYVCVANYMVKSHFDSKSKTALEIHNLLAEVYRFSFSKASVGYNTLRNRYGLGMNVVHPHRLRPPGAWYWVKESCRISWLDTKNDLRMNIGEYI